MELKPVIPPFPAFLALAQAFSSAQPEDLEQATGHLKERVMHYAIHVTPIAHLVPMVVDLALRFMATNHYHDRELIVVGLVPAAPSMILGYGL